MDGTNFDDLAKQLSATTSRREAMRLLGGTLAAGALATLLPGRVRAAGNSACAKFCESVFGENTPAAEQCAADATKHQGLCYTCGPLSLGGTQSICCPTTGSGLCTSYSSATCCSSDQTCQNGTCTSTCIRPLGQCDVTNPGACCTGICNPAGVFPFPFCS
jgi:hypothetical protein